MQCQHPHISIIKILFSFTIALAAAALSSCSNTKYIPKGETLYNGSSIKYVSGDTNSTETKAVLKDQLKAIILPKPNSKILGMRVKLWFYNIAGTPKGKGLRYFLRNKLGEPPVYTSAVNFEKNRNIMVNRLQNKGYFNASVAFDTTTKKYETKGLFTVKPAQLYTIDSITFPKDSSVLSKAIARTAKRSLLKQGNPYDLDVIKDERIRIDSRLKERGYFYFSENYLLLKADSTPGNNKVNLYMTVKKEAPPEARKPYRIGDVVIYAAYNLKTDTNFSKDKAVLYDSVYIVDPKKRFRTRMFRYNLRFHPGDLYNRKDHNLSLNRLVSLGSYKFVKARFEESDTADARLNAFYYLSPATRYSARAQISALTKSNNSTGTDLTLTFKNKNAFRSAEQLMFSVFGGLETQISGQQNIATTRFGSNIDLLIPRIIGPISFGINSDFVPHTKINLGYEYFRRTSQYTLNSFKTSYGWIWNTSINTEHQFNPISINYVMPSAITPQFQIALDTNVTLARSIEKQFILGSNYNYNYNSQGKPNRRRNNYYFNGNVDLSGNIAGLITGANASEGKEKKIFNTPFSQYIRGEAEFRHYLSLGRRNKEQVNQLVSRIIVGAGYGYGNSYTMPFIKQFFIGGTNSIRAYRARSLGPGTFYAGNPALKKTYLPDQPGDVKIEMNTELRFKLNSILRGALFMDAGNIYTIKTDSARPGSKFTSDFLKKFAVGTGVGLRVDIKFIVVRLDVAIPVRKPYLPGGPAWVFDQINFGSKEWRKANIVYNIAIGYPF